MGFRLDRTSPKSLETGNRILQPVLDDDRPRLNNLYASLVVCSWRKLDVIRILLEDGLTDKGLLNIRHCLANELV